MHPYPTCNGVCSCNISRTTAVACRALIPETSSRSTPQRSIRRACGADRKVSQSSIIVKPIGYAATPRTLHVDRRGLVTAAAAQQEGLQDIRQQQSLEQDSLEEEEDILDDEDAWDDAVGAEDEGAEEGEEDEEEEGESAAVMPEPAAKKRLDLPMSQTQVPYVSDEFVEVGLISRAHGIKGEVKVQLITDEPKKRLGTANKRLWLLPPPGQVAGAAAGAAGSGPGGPLLRRVVVQWGRVARPESKDRRAEWAVKFKEVLDRDEAQLLSGHKLLLALCDREATPGQRDEFFITDLVGLRAVASGSGVLLGVVTEVYDSSASYSLLRVRLAPTEDDIQQSRYRSVLVPFVEDFVPHVDVGQGVLQLAPPEGLMDTASSKKLRRPYSAEQQAQLRKQLRERQQQQQGLEQP